VLLAALVRAPFWDVARRTAVDGDTGVVGLMARHLGEGTTLWGQPYGSPLDAWVVAPAVALLGPTRLAARLPYFLLSLALVPLAAALARRVHMDAGPAAALLVASPPAYLLLLAALPPPLYPTTLVLLAVCLWLALDAPSLPRAVAWGLASGLATWTHLMSLAVVLPALALIAWRWRAQRRLLAAAVGALLLSSAPITWRVLRDPTAVSVVDVAHAGRGPLAHASAVAPRLHEPVLALVGAHTPVTADEAERVARPPRAIALVVIVLAAAGLVFGLRHGARPAAWLFAAVIAACVALFPFPVRSAPHTVRFLTPAVLPLLALVAAGATARFGRRRGILAAAVLAALQLAGAARLFGAWTSAGPAGLVPDCAPVRRALEERGLTRAFASYHTAYCVTYESGEAIVAAQPWNERFYGHPLRYRDAVRGAARVAGVLVPGADFDLPAPRTFEAKLAGIRAAYQRAQVGPAVVYHDFAPPFAPEVSGRVAGPAGDGDPRSGVRQTPAGAALFELDPPAEGAAALTLYTPAAEPLPALTFEVSADGLAFERVARRRPGREREELFWVNGHPEFVFGGPALTAVFDVRTVRAVRVTPSQAGGAWTVGEITVHPAASHPTPWPETSSPSDARGLFRRGLGTEP
jgi:hypothetical protein